MKASIPLFILPRPVRSFPRSHFRTTASISSPITLRSSSQAERPFDFNSLRVALAQNDLLRVQRIIASYGSSIISHHDMEYASRALVKQVESLPGNSSQSTSASDLHRLSIILASKSRPAPLVAFMHHYLTLGMADAVIGLWKDLQHIMDRMSHDGRVKSTPDASGPPGGVDPKSPGLGDAIGCVVVACAMTNNHDLALRSSLAGEFMIPILWSKTEAFANKVLGGDDEARVRFHQFLDDVKIVRLVARPFVASRHFTQLFENGEHTVAIKACGDLIRAVASSSPWIAPTDTDGWDSDGRYLAAVTEPLWSVILSGLMRANRKDLARSVWKLMGDLSVKRGTIVWNALLDGYGKAGQYEELKAVWDGMNQHHIPKDIFSYTSMISSLFQLRKSSEAALLFEEMRRAVAEKPLKSSPSDESDPNLGLHTSPSGSLTVAYNAVIHGLLICAQPNIAQSVLKDMKIHGPKPDITTYNTFLRHYSRKRETAAFTAILRDIPASGLRPDVVTFTMMLQLFIRSGKHQGVDRLDQAMSAMGVSPNTVSYSAIIDSVIRKGGENNVEAGLTLLRQMEDRGLTPNEVTFTAILAALRRDVSLTPAFVEHKREEIMNRMRQTGIQFNRVTFNVLIKACLERPGREGLTSAVDKYREMISAGVNPTDDTFYMLLLGAWTRRQLDIGYDLVEEMERIGFVPQNAVAELVDSIRKDGISTSFTF